ncbi:MAG: hypothetical protein AB8B72_02980 [Crocinitomicaceae bacterium]
MKKTQLFLLLFLNSFFSISLYSSNGERLFKMEKIKSTNTIIEEIHPALDTLQFWRKKVTICSCTELALQGMKEAGLDEEKMKAFEAEYKNELQKCDELGDKINEEMKSMSSVQQEEKRKEYMADCPAMEELEMLIMRLMQESYEEVESESATAAKSDSVEDLKIEITEPIEIDFDTAEKICKCGLLKNKKSDKLNKTSSEVLEKEYKVMRCSALLSKYDAHMSTLSYSEEQNKRREMNNFCDNLQRTEDLSKRKDVDEKVTLAKSNNMVEDAVVSLPEKVTICSCTELSLKGFKEVGMDQDKMKVFEEKHAVELQKCEELGNELNRELNSISDAEQEARRQMYMENCPAMRELEALIMEQMEKSMLEVEE